MRSAVAGVTGHDWCSPRVFVLSICKGWDRLYRCLQLFFHRSYVWIQVLRSYRFIIGLWPILGLGPVLGLWIVLGPVSRTFKVWLWTNFRCESTTFTDYRSLSLHPLVARHFLLLWTRVGGEHISIEHEVCYPDFRKRMQNLFFRLIMLQLVRNLNRSSCCSYSRILGIWSIAMKIKTGDLF